MSSFRSPPPPLAPPPSRETDVVFGTLLEVTAVLVLIFFGYLVVRYMSPKSQPGADDEAESPPSSTTYKSDQAEYTDDPESTEARFRMTLSLPKTILRPLRL